MVYHVNKYQRLGVPSNNMRNKNNDIDNTNNLPIIGQNQSNYPFGKVQQDIQIQQRYRERIRELCYGGMSMRNTMNDLPGPLPITLSRIKLDILCKYPYQVCEKSDGQRTMLYICNDGIFMIDRSFDIYILDINISNIQKDVQEVETLQDGELVYADIQGKKQYLYCMFDVIIVGTKLVRDLPFTERLLYLQNICKKFLHIITIKKIRCVIEQRNKKFVKASNQEDIIKNMEYNEDTNIWKYVNKDRDEIWTTDGQIFTPLLNDYMMSQHVDIEYTIYKYKWPTQQTVDQQIPREEQNNDRCRTIKQYTQSIGQHGGRAQPSLFTRARITYNDIEKQRSWQQGADSMIVECVYNSKRGNWEFLQIRRDKQVPNFITTVVSSMEALSENLTWQDIQRTLQLSSRAQGQS